MLAQWLQCNVKSRCDVYLNLYVCKRTHDSDTGKNHSVGKLNEHTYHLMVSNRRCPWTLETPKALQPLI
uniref:SFRICE_031442 n=1 Tax=Spodoptera frugiperda TaxID=7108 RepID=A0A2H1W6I9_SPOFR